MTICQHCKLVGTVATDAIVVPPAQNYDFRAKSRAWQLRLSPPAPHSPSTPRVSFDLCGNCDTASVLYIIIAVIVVAHYRHAWGISIFAPKWQTCGRPRQLPCIPCPICRSRGIYSLSSSFAAGIQSWRNIQAIYLYLSIKLAICMVIYIYNYISTNLFISLSAFLYINLLIYLTIYQYIHLSNKLSFYLSIFVIIYYLSILF